MRHLARYHRYHGELHGNNVLHEFFRAASFADGSMHLPVGSLRVCTHGFYFLDSLIERVDPGAFRTRDASGGDLPLHKACQANARLAMIEALVEQDPETVHIRNNMGAKPIHVLCQNNDDPGLDTVKYLIATFSSDANPKTLDGDLPNYLGLRESFVGCHL